MKSKPFHGLFKHSDNGFVLGYFPDETHRILSSTARSISGLTELVVLKLWAQLGRYLIKRIFLGEGIHSQLSLCSLRGSSKLRLEFLVLVHGTEGESNSHSITLVCPAFSMRSTKYS